MMKVGAVPSLTRNISATRFMGVSLMVSQSSLNIEFKHKNNIDYIDQVGSVLSLLWLCCQLKASIEGHSQASASCRRESHLQHTTQIGVFCFIFELLKIFGKFLR